MRLTPRQTYGFSLIEVILVSAVALIFFTGLISMVIYVVDLLSDARARLSALSGATERIEFIRSLAYDSVGTVAGIPNGAIPQNRTVTLNGYQFNERVLIEFVDDDADGLGAADSNSIIADYKRVKVEYSWNVTGATSTLALVSTVVPRSIETTAGGGTIRVNVFDALAAPLPGASVRLLNTTGTTTVDVTRTTDATGVALFAGAPAGSNYQIFVTDTGYSTDQTYVATTSNPNPNPAPISVLEADVSTMNFFIDRLADLSVQVFSSVVEGSITEPFTDLTGVASSSEVTTVGGELVLRDVAGVYSGLGTAYRVLTPSPLSRYGALSLVTSQPAGTDVRVRFYTGSSTFTLIPEADLPGNAAGFDARYVDLRALSVATYPAIVAGIELTTTNTAVTPAVDQVVLYYRESETPRVGESLTLRGAKTIGSDGGTPIYKYDVTSTTNGSGLVTATNIEWDTYTISFSGQTIRAVCADNPFSVAPQSDTEVEVVTGGASAHNVRLHVLDSAGLPIPGAAAELRRTGVLETDTTDACGVAFFSDGSIGAESDYEIEISAPGFVTTILTGESVSGDTVKRTVLSEI